MTTDTVWITGGNRGLGAAIAEACVNQGCQVAIMSSKADAQRSPIIDQLCASSPLISQHVADLSQPEQLSRCYAEIITRWGSLTALVCNATAPLDRKLLSKSTADIWRQHFEVAVTGHLHCYQLAMAQFKKQSKGSVVTLSTEATQGAATPRMSAYLAAKAALQSMTKSIAVEGARFNIRANCVLPSFMNTGLHGDLDPQVLSELMKDVRESQPQEVAEQVYAFIAGDKQEMTGQELIV
jgi:3-oxoacyl-[acyl-carrier protein] reductase